MPRRLMACALVAFFAAVLSSGCGSNEDVTKEVGTQTDEDREKEGQPESFNSDTPTGSIDDADGERSEGDREKIDLSQILPRKSDTGPTPASLEGLSFKQRPFKEMDGAKVLVEGMRKHYSNSIVVLHGKYTQFYGDGAKQAAGQYKDDMRDGRWMFWHPSGQKSKEGTYVDGLADGKWMHWRQDGSPRSEGEFRRGRRIGVWIFYDASGKKTTRDLSQKSE